MLYSYIMIVSNNNNLLNILLPNDNKALKEVLKEADSKTLESLNKGSTSVGDILKNLFSDLKTGEKNLSTIENLLKNSNSFKELGNFSKSISTLLDKLDPSMEKFRPLLEAFSKDISNLDANKLKDLISKSGVFLEAKTLQQTSGNQNMPKSLENILIEIKNVLKDIPNLQSKNLTNLIDKMLQKSDSSQQLTNDLKTLTNGLQEVSKGLNNRQIDNLLNLANALKNISSEGQLIESKIENFKPLQNSQNSQIENQTILQNKQDLITKTIDTLFQLKNEISLNNNLPNKQNLLNQIDTLLQSKDLFLQNNSQMEVKNMLNQLSDLIQSKDFPSSNNLERFAMNLKNQSDEIINLENKLFQNQNIQTEKNSLTKEIQQTLFNLKNEISNLNTPDNKLINQIIDKLLNIQNLFSKVEIPFDMKSLQQTNLLNNFQSNFASNINNLIVNLKESIVNLNLEPQNLNLHNTIFKNIEKLETIAHNLLQPSNLMDKQTTQNSLQNDIKAVLLQMQGELQTKRDTDSVELSKQVDKMVTQIEYHQLLSITSNSNNVYVPFIWDMLDNGTISMKKLEEDKFYCEINLSLKEFGQTRLLLALYDKNKLDMTIYVSKESFKQTFRENLTKLKQALNSANLIPVDIKIIDMKRDKQVGESKQNINPYGQNQDLNTGFNIRV